MDAEKRLAGDLKAVLEELKERGFRPSEMNNRPDCAMGAFVYGVLSDTFGDDLGTIAGALQWAKMLLDLDTKTRAASEQGERLMVESTAYLRELREAGTKAVPIERFLTGVLPDGVVAQSMAESVAKSLDEKAKKDGFDPWKEPWTGTPDPRRSE